MEIAPLTELGGNSQYHAQQSRLWEDRPKVLKPTAAKNVHKSEVTTSATKLSLIMSQQKCKESECDHDCLMEMKDKLRKGTAVSESCTSDKWSIQCVTCVSVPEIEKCMFCPINSCLKWVMVKLARYEHNYLTFSQFVWSWMTENMWNSRVNMNIIISRENTFLLWHSFFVSPLGWSLSTCQHIWMIS